MTSQQQFHELCFYTLAHESQTFIHQHAVDAYAAQTADADTKPITLFFALAGLYLFLVKNYTGKQVQAAHVQMTKKPKAFEKIGLPENRGSTTVKEVLEAPPGTERDAVIKLWCVSVWTAFAGEHEKIIAMTEKQLAK